ncbi:hypothetical protein V8G54_016719 [Vigna mungo]|uniref:Uncharacterized protein n=1 Tax=Vigna mungo TaxID=3915 RepID=A0AAQ3RY42_VIGMU
MRHHHYFHWLKAFTTFSFLFFSSAAAVKTLTPQQPQRKHQRTKSPSNPFITDKQPQEKKKNLLFTIQLQTTLILQQTHSVPYRDKVQPNPPHALIRKQKRGAMEEEWRREEGLEMVDEKNIPDQQEQHHQWRMNINNTSDEDDGGSGALGSGDDEEARTSGDNEERSKP